MEIFARFLEEYYDPDDLLFFLYVRSVTQKELNINFRARWSEMGRNNVPGSSPSKASTAGGADKEGAAAPSAVYLTFRECAVVSRVAFGNEADPLYKTFMAMIERNMTGSKKGREDKRKIDVTQFLHLALVEYHETRPADDGSGAGGDAPSGSSNLGGSGMSAGSPSAADKLFQSASRAYDMRTGSLAGKGNGDLTLQDIDSGNGGGSGSGGGARPASAALLEKLGEVMHTANQAYLDKLLAGAGDLPAEVSSQIRTELQGQLESKVDSLLAAAITSAQTGSPSNSGDVDKLASKFSKVVNAAASNDGAVEAGQLRPFCDAVLATDEVKRIVEPLVTLLVTYAKGKLAGQ